MKSRKTDGKPERNLARGGTSEGELFGELAHTIATFASALVTVRGGAFALLGVGVEIEVVEEDEDVKKLRIKVFPPKKIKVKYTKVDGTAGEKEFGPDDVFPGGAKVNVKPGTKTTVTVEGERGKWIHDQTA